MVFQEHCDLLTATDCHPVLSSQGLFLDTCLGDPHLNNVTRHQGYSWSRSRFCWWPRVGVISKKRSVFEEKETFGFLGGHLLLKLKKPSQRFNSKDLFCLDKTSDETDETHSNTWKICKDL